MANIPSVISSGGEKSFSTQEQTMIMTEPLCLGIAVANTGPAAIYSGTLCALTETLQSSADKGATV
jgi:hypothetical protein